VASRVAGVATGAAHRADRGRRDLERRLRGLLDTVVPVVVEEVVRRVDLTTLIARHVDVDRIVSQVDLDRAVAGLDVDAVVRRVDVEAILDRFDLTRMVIERVDLDQVVNAVDLDEVVQRVDIDAIVRRLDLDLVLDRLDVDAVVARVDIDGVAGRLDLDRLVAGIDLDALIDRIDLVTRAEALMAELDLPELIRESTGSMASDTVRGVRMQGIAGDEALTRVVDRLRLRRTGSRPGPLGPGGDEGRGGMGDQQPAASVSGRP
jgi:hypothetical protein